MDEKNLHVYKIIGSGAVFVTHFGNAPFGEEIKNHINGNVVNIKRTVQGSEIHISKINNTREYFLTESDDCDISPESYNSFYNDLIYELERDYGGFRKMTNI